MTDRIDECRYQNAIQIRDNLKKKLDNERTSKTFAERLSRIEKRTPDPLYQPKQHEIKTQVRPKDRREKLPVEEKKQEPQKAKVSDRLTQPRAKPAREKKESDQFFQFAAQFTLQSPKASSEPLPTAQSMLPSPVVNELIERIYTCSASDGQKMVSIRLKGNVLAGAQIDVSISDREVNLGFQHTTAEVRHLLRNSKHLLKSRLAEKKLSLRDFAFH